MTTHHKTYELRCYLTKGQHARLENALKECCDLYNSLRTQRIWEYRDRDVFLGKYDQQKMFTQAKKGDYFWEDIDTHVAREVIARIDNAFKDMNRRVKEGQKAGFPRFKPYNQYRSFGLNEVGSYHFRYRPSENKSYITIKGLPTITVKPNRPLPPTESLVKLRLVKKPAAWYAYLTYEFEAEPQLTTGQMTGIDMGVNNRMALADGEMVESRIPDRDREKKLQQQLDAVTKKDSHGRMLKSEDQNKYYRKARKALARETYRNKIRNRNYCHQKTTDLVRRFELICAEDLHIMNLVKSLKGTIDEPGVGVSAKRSLNRRILEQTWGLLISQIQYKAAWAGTLFVKVNPAYTSRECSNCGERSKQEEYRVYFCEYCESIFDRDTNAARNILIRGLVGVGLALNSEEAVKIAALTLSHRGI